MLFDAPAERPQSVGDLIGRGFRVYRRHLPLFFKTLLGPSVIAVIGALMLHWTVSRGWSSSSGNLAGMLVCSALIVAGFFILLVAKWVLTLRQLAFVRMAAGYNHDYAGSYSIMRKRKWKVLSLYVLGVIFSLLTALVLIGLMLGILMLAPKAGLAAGLAVAFTIAFGLGALVFSLALILLSIFVTLSVIACEEGDLNRLVSRGLNLVSADFPRACGFGLLLCLSVWMMSFPLSLPVVAISSGDLIQQGLTSERLADSFKVPVYVMVISQVWESLVNMLLWPAVYLSFGFFYYDMRFRQEGLDMLRTLDELEKKTA